MKEIEFRAWINDEYMCNSEELPNHLDENGKFIPFMQNLNNWYMDDGQTLGDFLSMFGAKNVMQYTGIKDKNGTKIYENDILKYINLRDEESIIQVWWDEEDNCFNFGNRNLSMIRNKIEVIGNMCDNPELLEGENNGI